MASDELRVTAEVVKILLVHFMLESYHANYFHNSCTLIVVKVPSLFLFFYINIGKTNHLNCLCIHKSYVLSFTIQYLYRIFFLFAAVIAVVVHYDVGAVV